MLEVEECLGCHSVLEVGMPGLSLRAGGRNAWAVTPCLDEDILFQKELCIIVVKVNECSRQF